ncbi:translation initiation factor IF-2-like [Dipodomys spectabilis]|uniref:translation initiation factor IF-2-like n=1 Tax=Dipodomys spectabilis TaxID=105255 RepID=UPI001C546651|nr:translation initiation factor IF-2-like [Dipodomys spectabilis]
MQPRRQGRRASRVWGLGRGGRLVDLGPTQGPQKTQQKEAGLPNTCPKPRAPRPHTLRQSPCPGEGTSSLQGPGVRRGARGTRSGHPLGRRRGPGATYGDGGGSERGGGGPSAGPGRRGRTAEAPGLRRAGLRWAPSWSAPRARPLPLPRRTGPCIIDDSRPPPRAPAAAAAARPRRPPPPRAPARPRAPPASPARPPARGPPTLARRARPSAALARWLAGPRPRAAGTRSARGAGAGRGRPSERSQRPRARLRDAPARPPAGPPPREGSGPPRDSRGTDRRTVKQTAPRPAPPAATPKR